MQVRISFLDIPNVKNVKLPHAFDHIRKKSISSIDCLIDLISFIDVSAHLSHLVKEQNYKRHYLRITEKKD